MTDVSTVLGAPAPEAAPAILGWELHSHIGGETVVIRLTETEAYTEDDPASHSYRGVTPRNPSMFAAPGTLYVYRSYGVHWCANVSVGGAGIGEAVLLRGGTIVAGRDVCVRRRGRSDHLVDGPGKLCQALGIDGSHDGVSLLSSPDLRLVAGRRPGAVEATTRVGVSKGRDLRWRFVASGCEARRANLPDPVTISREPDEQLRRLLRGVDTVTPREAFDEKLRERRPLRVKLGLDPTAPAVTLGWAVVLRKLRHFQEMGHTAVLIVGDFTAQVGDPSGRSETRRRLSSSDVTRFAESVLDQFRAVLLPEPLEVRYNSEWLAELGMADVLELTSHATVAQMLERSDFADRYRTGIPISVMEFLYPLLQGYDSVAVRADVELGGTDQLWNLMMGRVIQERYGLPAQVAVTMPLLVGTDGSQKMSQSLGNYVGIDEPADEMFGKTMSIPDELMEQWFRLATEVPTEEVDAIVASVSSGELHPGEAKRRLGREIVDLYHGAGSGDEAEEAFDRLFRRHDTPEDLSEHVLGDDDPSSLPELIRDAGLASSGGEARRLIEQGAVRIDGERVDTQEVPRDRLVGSVLQVGKRRFVRLTGEDGSRTGG